VRQQVTTGVLVIGSGTAGVAAALQCARRGVRVALVGEDRQLGGMFTAQGVSACDGNELMGFQTGLWRVFLQELYRRQTTGLHHSWVSFFTFDPRVGEGIFRDWVQELVPRLLWLPQQQLFEVRRQGDRVTGAVFTDYEITAQVTIDATELGDGLHLGGVPYRWGWETQAIFQEPSAPVVLGELHHKYPVQALTWVALLQGAGGATEIVPSAIFQNTFRQHSPARMLSYGALTPDLYMVNWPQDGNDYAVDLDRLVTGVRADVLAAARAHTRQFITYLQQVFGPDLQPAAFLPGGLAQQPYYRESRRVVGLKTVTELDILPVAGGRVAALDRDWIAFGNYANDHHYPGDRWPVASKATVWGGRWTGTPFGIPYGALVPATVDGLLVTERNISVSHIANGATRLQPLVLNLGQVAGLAAALCVERGLSPHELPVMDLQFALLTEPTAPAGVVPFYNLTSQDPRYPALQQAILQGGPYSPDGQAPVSPTPAVVTGKSYRGTLFVAGSQSTFATPELGAVPLVTLEPTVAEFLANAPAQQEVQVVGIYYPKGVWFAASAIGEVGIGVC